MPKLSSNVVLFPNKIEVEGKESLFTQKENADIVLILELTKMAYPDGEKTEHNHVFLSDEQAKDLVFQLQHHIFLNSKK